MKNWPSLQPFPVGTSMRRGWAGQSAGIGDTGVAIGGMDQMMRQHSALAVFKLAQGGASAITTVSTARRLALAKT